MTPLSAKNSASFDDRDLSHKFLALRGIQCADIKDTIFPILTGPSHLDPPVRPDCVCSTLLSPLINFFPAVPRHADVCFVDLSIAKAFLADDLQAQRSLEEIQAL